MRRWITSRRLRCMRRLEAASNGTVNVVQINTKSREKNGKINMYPKWVGGSAAVRNLWNGFRGPLIPPSKNS